MKRTFQSLLAAIITIFVLTTTAWAADDTPPTETEMVVTRAFLLRAIKLEESSGFSFDKDWDVKVSIVQGLNSMDDAEYQVETQTVLIPNRIIYRLNREYGTPVRLLNPAVLANDGLMGSIIDHELGHILMDRISRRNNCGPFYRRTFYYLLSVSQQYGLKTLAEGVGHYFRRFHYPDDTILSPYNFPSTLKTLYALSGLGERYMKIITEDGGLWLVNDVLDKYKERGLLWLIRHPLTLDTNNMRAAAVAYHNRALEELARQ